MGNTVNVTYITLDGYVELHKYRYVYFVVMFSVYVLILCCNSTIVGLIVVHENLHEPMYVFIAALLINSVLFSSVLYPKLLVDVLSENQVISYSLCLFQFHVFYSLGGSEFLLLSVMSYDRYVSICRPLRYPTLMSRANVGAMLAAAWLLPSCLFAVAIVKSSDSRLCNFTFSGIICNSTVVKLHCEISQLLNVYGLVCFVCILVLPVLFIIFTYIRILVVSYRSCRAVRRKAARTCLPHLLVLINFSCLGAYDILLLRLESNFPKIVRLIMSLQVILYHPLFNPIIYGLKMTEICKQLVRLLGPVRTV